MKLKLIILLIALPFLLTGCVDFDLGCMMFSWVPGSTCSSSSHSSGSSSATTTTTVKSSSSGGLEVNNVQNIEVFCSQIPNMVASEEGTCVCKPGYGDWMGQCVKLTGPTCHGDIDCGKPYCSGVNKVVPRCDLRNNQCLPAETVSCLDYGSGYTCNNGNCVKAITK